MKPEKNPRMDTTAIKAQLFKKVGQERFKRYFHCLNRFINQKLSKSEFDKSCYQILGRENLPLHNQIIRAILKNASSSKSPPPQAREAGPGNKVGIVGGTSLPVLKDGRNQNRSSVAPIWSNGVVPISPRKGRSTVRDRKLKDRARPLCPNGKLDFGAKTLENGDLAPCDYQRPLQQPRGLAEQPVNNDKLIIKRPADVSGVSRGSNHNNVAHIEGGEEAAQASQLMFCRRSLIAPLGIPFCSGSIGGARKALPVTHTDEYVSCFDLGGLTDSEALRRRVEQISAAQGIGVTLECANTLNNMVDVHLKRLIRSCLELVGSRSTIDTSTNPVQKQQMHGKPINGFWPNNHLHMQNSSGVEAQRFNESVSLLDFKVAMELNPQQLGENWPILLEKISMQGFEE